MNSPHPSSTDPAWVDPIRSAMMRSIRQKHTAPELIVRRALHAEGFRFRLHRRDLPGTPDIVLPKYQTVIFVHGCFWHRHEGCSRTTTPKTRYDFWQSKFAANVARDRAKVAQLRDAGWTVLTVWECEARHPEALARKLRTEVRSSRDLQVGKG